MSTTHTLPITALDGLYEITDRAQVATYLARYPFLLPLLMEAREPIRQHFADSRVFLEVMYDPEAIGIEELLAVISPTCSPEEAVAKFDQLFDDWWLAKMDESEERLYIILNYR